MSWMQEYSPTSRFSPDIHKLFPLYMTHIEGVREEKVGNGKMSLKKLNLAFEEDLGACDRVYNSPEHFPYLVVKDGETIEYPNNHDLTTEQIQEMFYNRCITHTTAKNIVKFSKSPLTRPDIVPLAIPTCPDDYREGTWVLPLPSEWAERYTNEPRKRGLLPGLFEPRLPSQELSNTHKSATPQYKKRKVAHNDNIATTTAAAAAAAAAAAEARPASPTTKSTSPGTPPAKPASTPSTTASNEDAPVDSSTPAASHPVASATTQTQSAPSSSSAAAKQATVEDDVPPVMF